MNRLALQQQQQQQQQQQYRCGWLAKMVVCGFLILAGLWNMQSSQKFFYQQKSSSGGVVGVGANQQLLLLPPPPPCIPSNDLATTTTTAAVVAAVSSNENSIAASTSNAATAATAPQPPPLPPKLFKYILFTTARSGSTWTCQLLDALPNISCGLLRTHLDNKSGSTNADDELLLKYSYMGNGCCPKKDENGNPLQYGNLTYEQYQYDFDTAMNKSIRAKQQQVPHLKQRGGRRRGHQGSGGSTAAAAAVGSAAAGHGRAAGFKLMYDQIPPMFLDQLLHHWVEDDIAILHMVREASILRMASVNNYKTKKILHTTNTTLAALTKSGEDSELVTFSNLNATVKRVQMVESVDALWQRRLSFFPKLRYHYISYESLLSSPSREGQLWQVLSFLKPFLDPIAPSSSSQSSSSLLPVPSTTTTSSTSSSSYHDLIQQAIHSTTLLQLHQPLCSKRIQDYDELRLLLEGTRTASACDLLERLEES
jgi:hypothetical protein